MAYDIFSQLQGPQIDVDLFGRNTTNGINAGNASPTALTSGINGFVKGIQTGQQIYANYQDSQIKQNQIEQLPVTNAMQQAQLENQQAVASINESKAKIQTANEALELKAQESALKLEAQTAETKLNDANTIQKLQEQMAVNPAQALADSRNPEVAAALIRNPVAGEQFLATVESYGIPKEQYKDLQSGIRAESNRQLQIERSKAEFNATNKVAEDRVKNYAEAEYHITGMIKGNVPDDYDPRKLKPVKQDNSLTEPTKGDTYSLEYDGKHVADLAGVEDYNRAVKNIQEITAWKTSKGLLPTTPTPTAPPIAPPPPNTKPNASAFNNAANAAPPVATPPPTPPPGAAVMPTNQRDSIPVQSQDAITQQASNDLIRRAQTDPKIRERLIAKGLLKPGMIQPGPTPAPGAATSSASASAPSATVPPAANAAPAASNAPVATPAPGATVPASQAGTPTPVSVSASASSASASSAPTLSASAPVATPTPIPVAQRVSTAHAALPKPVQKLVDPATVTKVASNPELQGLDPLHQALISVESSGNRLAKAKGKGATAEGYFQLTAGAAKDMRVNKSDPAQNIKGGVAYIDTLLKRYNNNEVAAVMAYNLGMGVIDSAISITGGADYQSLVFGIEYMHDRGMYPKSLNGHTVRVGKAYPLKVQAYKQVFQNV